MELAALKHSIGANREQEGGSLDIKTKNCVCCAFGAICNTTTRFLQLWDVDNNNDFILHSYSCDVNSGNTMLKLQSSSKNVYLQIFDWPLLCVALQLNLNQFVLFVFFCTEMNE